MKKLFSVLIVLVAAIASTMLVSCSKNDDDKVNSQTVVISLEPNEDILAMFDISAVYTDGNGNTQTEAISGNFTKSFAVSSFPATGTISIKATAKSTIKEGKYSPSIKVDYEASSLYTKEIWGSPVNISSQTEAQEYADKKLNSQKLTWKFLADGSVEKPKL